MVYLQIGGWQQVGGCQQQVGVKNSKFGKSRHKTWAFDGNPTHLYGSPNIFHMNQNTQLPQQYEWKMANSQKSR